MGSGVEGWLAHLVMFGERERRDDNGNEQERGGVNRGENEKERGEMRVSQRQEREKEEPLAPSRCIKL